MILRIAGAVSALAAVALFGVVGCTNSEEASTSTGSTPSVVQAQEILRTLISPDTTPAAAAALVDSPDRRARRCVRVQDTRGPRQGTVPGRSAGTRQSVQEEDAGNIQG